MGSAILTYPTCGSGSKLEFPSLNIGWNFWVHLGVLVDKECAMKTSRRFLVLGFTFVLAAATLLASAVIAQDATSSSSGKSEQWIHVRVESKEDHGETVRVNVPVEMAAKVIPAINKNNLHGGKVPIDSMHTGDVEFRGRLAAGRSPRAGENDTGRNRGNEGGGAKRAGQ